MADRVEKRREARVKATYAARVLFLEGCQNIAKSTEVGGDTQRITPKALQTYRDEVASKVSETDNPFTRMTTYMGFKHPTHNLLEILDKAVEVCEANNSQWLYYQDFAFYYTVSVSKWPWLRSEMRVACFIVFLYYFFTPILFCHIVDEQSICIEGENSYDGWMSSLYFASTVRIRLRPAPVKTQPHGYSSSTDTFDGWLRRPQCAAIAALALLHRVLVHGTFNGCSGCSLFCRCGQRFLLFRRP